MRLGCFQRKNAGSDEGAAAQACKEEVPRNKSAQTGSNDMFAHLPYVENLDLVASPKSGVACVAARTLRLPESGLIQIAEHTHACRARGHARRHLGAIERAHSAETAFVDRTRALVNHTRLVMARSHAVFAADAATMIDAHDVVRCHNTRRGGKPPGIYGIFAMHAPRRGPLRKEAVGYTPVSTSENFTNGMLESKSF